MLFVVTSHTHFQEALMDTLTIRPATQSDAVALRQLAALDSASPPTGEPLVAEVDGEVWAALDPETGVAIADPFQPSGELVGLLRFRAARQNGSTEVRAPKRRLLPRLA
jgi:hypothetical protein